MQSMGRLFSHYGFGIGHLNIILTFVASLSVSWHASLSFVSRVPRLVTFVFLTIRNCHHSSRRGSLASSAIREDALLIFFFDLIRTIAAM